MITRRKFLKLAALAGIAASGPVDWLLNARIALAFSQSPGLSRFTQPLRGVFPLDPNGIPVAIPDGTRSWNNGQIVASHYTIDIKQFQDQLHPALGPTTLWGYNPRNALSGPVPQRHLGGIVIAQRGTPVQLTVQNKLTGPHILPVDTTIMGSTDQTDHRTTLHLHGGFVPWISDGGPFTWFDDAGNYGPSIFVHSRNKNFYKILNPDLLRGQAEYYYPNDQSARLMWYHDHAIGITRLNAYAGLATAYILRDAFEGGLRNRGLPDFIENGGREIPLVIQEKIFVGPDIATSDPTWSSLGLPDTPGSLWYPHVYDTARWDLGSGLPVPDVSCVPEFFGDTLLVNGVVHPFVDVEPRRYRLRILNATQASFLNLQLYEDDGNGNPVLGSKGPAFLVLGTEGGFLANPVLVPSNKPLNFLDPPFNQNVDVTNPGGSLLTAPAERWDVVIDFKEFKGKNFILTNDAPAPFPSGDPVNDYPNANNPGANTHTIMQFRVGKALTGRPDTPLRITTSTPLALDPNSGINPFLVPLNVFVDQGHINLPPGIPVRNLTLNEVFDQYGRLIQMLGTNQVVPLPAGFSFPAGTPDAPNSYARGYMDPTTETASAGATEIWAIANLTGDVHPMHFHLVNVQVLARQSFTDASGNYLYTNGVPTFTAPAETPPPTEAGWKETVKMYPGTVTWVIMKFDLPSVPFDVPDSPRTGGKEYVWHCHILEHEEHDMMRPLVVS